MDIVIVPTSSNLWLALKNAPHTLGSICRILEMRWVGIRQRRMDAKFSLFNGRFARKPKTQQPKIVRTATRRQQRRLSLCPLSGRRPPAPGEKTLSRELERVHTYPHAIRLLAGAPLSAAFCTSVEACDPRVLADTTRK
jgi:hypothetical protein